MPSPYVLGIQNPDSASIATKQTIDISFSWFDVSASMQTASIKPNYTNTGMIVISNEPVDIPGRGYYTPIYTEKLNYDEWVARTNKTFNELD
jgi:hypothetical protein